MAPVVSFRQVPRLISTCQRLMSTLLTKGSPLPSLEANKLRIYGHPFCPYVERVTLVLAAKHIDHEVVNIDLIQKPDWIYTKNIHGTVPVLEWDEKILRESLVIADYLDAVFAEKGSLHPKDPYAKAQGVLMVEEVKPFTTAISRVVKDSIKHGLDKEVAWSSLNESIGLLETLIAKRSGKYFSGDALQMSDYMIWPFLERLPALLEFVNPMIDDQDSEVHIKKCFPAIDCYSALLRENSAVKKVILSKEEHKSYLSAFIKDKT